jgi:hypothetical protein
MNPYATSSSRPVSTPGVETKRVLLALGALCLGGALFAGTALVWSALGASGQVALMLAITALALVTAIALRRLPSTAEAVASVGVTGMFVDAIAARTLGLASATDWSLHVYVAVAATVIACVSVAVAVAAPALRAPLIGATVAPLVTVFAVVNPVSFARGSLLGPAALVTAIAAERLLQRRGCQAHPARCVNAAGTSLLTLGSVVANAHAAYTQQQAAWWGAVLIALVFALPELAGLRADVVEMVTASASGLVLTLLAGEASAHTSTNVRLVAIGALPVLVAATVPLRLRGVWMRLRLAGGIAGGLLALAAWASLDGSEVSMLAANASLTGVALLTSLTWPGDRADAESIRLGSALMATIFGTTAAALALDLASVHVVEAYVATPALSWGLLGLLEMRRDRSMRSTVLLPGILVGTLPTLAIALHGDATREVALLFAAALLVVVGAQLRWAAPLAVGTIEISMLVLRIIGPEVVHLPRWISLAIVGTVLLILGATWEARLADIQRIRAGIRPHVNALR